MSLAVLSEDQTLYIYEKNTVNISFYYRGLKEYKTEKGYLMDTCLSAQDQYEKMVAYFFPDFSQEVLDINMGNSPKSYP